MIEVLQFLYSQFKNGQSCCKNLHKNILNALNAKKYLLKCLPSSLVHQQDRLPVLVVGNDRVAVLVKWQHWAAVLVEGDDGPPLGVLWQHWAAVGVDRRDGSLAEGRLGPWDGPHRPRRPRP